MDEYDSLKISDLRDLLSARGLSTTYRVKSDLVERLRKNRLVSTARLGDDDNDTVILNSSVEEDEVFDNTFNGQENNGQSSQNNTFNGQENNGESSQNNTNGQENNGESSHSDTNGQENNGDNSQNNGGNGDGFSNQENSYDNGEHINDDMAPVISFKDVEEALETFGGAPHENITKWIASFDKISTTCGWNDVQKFIFALKLMKGEARASVEADTISTTYEELTTYLKQEYPDKTTILDIHNMLIARKKQHKESLVEYMYAMQKIGKAKMDVASMIRYIVDGILIDKKFKMMLYEATSYEELKAKLKIFQTNFENYGTQPNGKDNNRKKHNTDKHNTEKHSKKFMKKCNNCGDQNHHSNDCPDKDKGAKCYNCNHFGHIAKDCRVPRKPKENPTSKDERKGVMCLVPGKNRKKYIRVMINNMAIEAKIDSGSPHTIMTKATYKSIKGLGRWTNYQISLKGLSESEVFTLGYKIMDLSINDEVYNNIQCHIVADHLMPLDMILVDNVTDLAEITMIAGVITMRKIVKEIPENDIMLIEPVENKSVEDLQCIQEIQDINMRKEVIKLITNYKPKVGKKSCIQMEILVEDNVPVYQQPRRLSMAQREVANEMVAKFIAEGIVRPSRSPYASPILLRQKKNGKHRMCIDYRKINSKIIKDRYPLPLMEDIIEDLYPDEVFSSLDLVDGFYHVDMKEDSIKYTAFNTPDGQWEFLKAPQGLCNSPANFQRYINTVFQEAKQEKLLKLYLDDVLISSKDERSNLNKLTRTLAIAAEAGLKINFNKCKFIQRRILFLGNIIENHKIYPSDEKKQAIEKFPVPTTVKKVQSFLGLTGYFRKFIEHYALIARPLTKLTQKDQPFRFGTDELNAFNILKEKLCADVVLRIYNPKTETELHTDASCLGYGGCMLQLQADDGKMHPVYFLSYKTTPAESKLHSYELEVLAIMKCLDKLRVYLLGITFTVYTDCQAFQQTMEKKNAIAKIARWALAMEDYDMKVKHRPASAMRHVDALSRNAVMLVEEGLVQQIKNAQLADNECTMLRLTMEKTKIPNYVQRDGLLYHFQDGYYRLKVPKAMAYTILTRIHGEKHLSKMRMEKQAQQDYHITDLGKIVDKILTNCIACVLATKNRGKKDGWLHPIDKFDVPLHTYHIDHVGPMQSTAKNYQHILVVVDGFTKFTWLYPTKTTKCEEAITKVRLQQTTFGNPVRIIADKGSAFTADAFDEYCKLEDIQLHLVTTATPRGNGQVERINGIVKPTITKMAIKEPTKWYKYVDKLQRCINSTVSRSIGTTPFHLMFGVQMKSADDLQLLEVLEKELISNFQENRSKNRQAAALQIAKVQLENQIQYNKKRKEPRLYKVGDLVAIDRVKTEKGAKFKTKMIGPYEVTRVLRHDRYEVRKIGFGDGPMNTSTAADRMKPWADGQDSSDDE